MSRTETDALGEVAVPEDAYYGAFTVRARQNFALTGDHAHPTFIQALGRIKQAAAQSNSELGLLDVTKADAICDAAREVVDGKFADQFILDALQAGAGTPFHMNVNEVIANRATELLGGEKGEYLVDPHDDVNMGQSSNNVIPTAVRLATVELADSFVEELMLLADAFRERGDAFENVVKVGRTHLQDAVPITLGQEFHAYATHCETGVDRIEQAVQELHIIGLGGNAIGTGINTDPSFHEDVVEHLADVTGHALLPAEDGPAITQSMAPFAAFTGSVRSLVTDLIKVADDLMLLASGPNAGLHEIELPEVEPGSSIMPGKVNPSIVEAFKMACIQALGHDHAVSVAAQEGDLELNVMTPVIARNVFDMLDVLTNAVRMLREDCVTGITADKDQITELFAHSTATATALNPYLGYDATAEVVKTAMSEDRSVRDVVIETGLMDAADVDRVLQPDRLTQPGGIDQDLVEKYR